MLAPRCKVGWAPPRRLVRAGWFVGWLAGWVAGLLAFLLRWQKAMVYKYMVQDFKRTSEGGRAESFSGRCLPILGFHLVSRKCYALLIMSLHWSADDITIDCFHRFWSTLCADPALRDAYDQPVSRHCSDKAEALANNQVVAVNGQTGCGKTYNLLQLLFEKQPFNMRLRTEYPVCIVLSNCFAAEDLRARLLVLGWSWNRLHLWTGREENHFMQGQHLITITTYGMLWKWVSLKCYGSSASKPPSPLSRYAAFFLDEFAYLEPKYTEAARVLATLVRNSRLWGTVRIIVAGCGINKAYVQEMLGDHAFIDITGRQYTMERCVVAPKTPDVDPLKLAVHLTLQALGHKDPQKGTHASLRVGCTNALLTSDSVAESMDDYVMSTAVGVLASFGRRLGSMATPVLSVSEKFDAANLCQMRLAEEREARERVAAAAKAAACFAEAERDRDEIENLRLDVELEAHERAAAAAETAARLILTVEARRRRADLIDAITRERGVPFMEDPPLPLPMPRFMYEGDDRFNNVEERRVYACDSCGHIVQYCSKKRKMGSRVEGAFQGAYLDHRWDGTIPSLYLRRAYQEGLIDCTWHCSQLCKTPMNGKKDQ